MGQQAGSGAGQAAGVRESAGLQTVPCHVPAGPVCPEDGRFRSRCGQEVRPGHLHLPLSLFYLLPASLQMLSASLVATLASWLGETAENVSNECRERTEDRGQRTDVGDGQLARRNKSRRRRRS